MQTVHKRKDNVHYSESYFFLLNQQDEILSCLKGNNRNGDTCILLELKGGRTTNLLETLRQSDDDEGGVQIMARIVLEKMKS